jgi:site-specific recombinase XerC
LDARDVTRWLRTVERWLNPRDRVLALIPFYAGLRLGEVVALDLDDIRLSARKGLIIVRMGEGGGYREIPGRCGKCRRRRRRASGTVSRAGRRSAGRGGARRRPRRGAEVP